MGLYLKSRRMWGCGLNRPQELIKYDKIFTYKDEAMKNQTFKLLDVSCASCVKTIESALNKIKGIEYTVNFAQRIVSITGKVDPSIIIKTIHQAGYTAEFVGDSSHHDATDNQYSREKILKTTFAILLGSILFASSWFDWLPTLTTVLGQSYWGAIGVITLIGMWYCGGHIYRAAWQALKHFNATMDSLIALGTGAAWLYSMLVCIVPAIVPVASQHVYFEAAIMIIGFINLGQLLEMRARGKTSVAINRLLDLQPKMATIMVNGIDKKIPLNELRVNDLVRVKPGEKIPADGVITEGQSTINEAMITGESMPVNKKIGDKVIGGTMNKTGSFLVQVLSVGDETTLAKIIQLVQQAQNSKPKIAKLVDQVAGIFTPVVLIIAVLTAVCWFLFGPKPVAAYMLVTAMSVLVIACPCALGLAAPMSIMVGMGKAAEVGALIRNGQALQLATQLTVILIDKTGTLTKGTPEVVDVFTVNEVSQEKLLRYAASIERGSEHPLASAIVAAAHSENLALLTSVNFQAAPGYGVQATLDEETVLLGNKKWLHQHKINIDLLENKANSMAVLGYTPIYVAIGGQAMGVIAIADPIKPNAKLAIKKLKQRGLKIIMLTGDNIDTASAVARQLGIKNVEADVLPADKAAMVKKYQQRGDKVGMVGDGINDAPALAQADVGFAMGSGTDVAIESADVTLMNSSPLSIPNTIAVSTATMRNIKQNLWGAFVYNAAGIPIAAGVLYPWFHFLLNPMVGALAMALSSVTVVSNANRLRLWKAG